MVGKKTLIIITYFIGVLTFISCIISISNNNIYKDGEWANSQWLGQDIVTLFLALPLLCISFTAGIKKGNIKWQMVYVGILLYFFYTYSFFMFGANLTFLYLLHLPIYGFSTIGLIITCIGLFNQNISYSLNKKGVRWGIIFYLVFISFMITYLWLNDIILHLIDPLHRSDVPDGEAPLLIYSLDLGIIIPLMLSAAVLLYKRTKWGFILNGIILTKTSTLGFALMSMAISMHIQKLNPNLFLIILWFTIGIFGTLLTLLYFKKLTFKN